MQTEAMISYQLEIKLIEDTRIQIGKLGTFTFPSGNYIYTGSAKRNIEARIKRHLSNNKNLHWHIDYLLKSPLTEVTETKTSMKKECSLNQQVNGEIIVPRFGASDCENGCGSHLKYTGN